MAAKSDTASAPTYVEGTDYIVTLSKVVEWPVGSGIMYSPRNNPHVMTGAVCTEIASGIGDAQPV